MRHRTPKSGYRGSTECYISSILARVHSSAAGAGTTVVNGPGWPRASGTGRTLPVSWQRRGRRHAARPMGRDEEPPSTCSSPLEGDWPACCVHSTAGPVSSGNRPRRWSAHRPGGDRGIKWRPRCSFGQSSPRALSGSLAPRAGRSLDRRRRQLRAPPDGPFLGWGLSCGSCAAKHVPSARTRRPPRCNSRSGVSLVPSGPSIPAAQLSGLRSRDEPFRQWGRDAPPTTRPSPQLGAFVPVSE